MSHGARVCLIKSVQSSIKSYWAQLFILPKKIIKEVNFIVWNKAVLSSIKSYSKFAPIAWEYVCFPYKLKGYGIKNFIVWNKAAVMKHFWAIDKSKDRLWLKWIHAYYTKANSVFDIGVPTVATWMVKKLLSMRSQL